MTGAAGTLEGCVIQLAKAEGLTVVAGAAKDNASIITTRGDKDERE